MRFTVRRPPLGEVSPCCHRPSGGDVACSVDVGAASARCAGLALEDRLALAIFRCGVPAHRASLRRVRGRDLLDPTVSLVLQPGGEKPPTAAADRPIQSALLSNTNTRLIDGPSRGASHRPHVEGFDPDRVEAARDVSGGLGLDTRWHAARQPKPHPAHLGHPHPTEPAVEPHKVMWFAAWLPTLLLLNREIPQVACVATVLQENHFLRSGGDNRNLDILAK